MTARTNAQKTDSCYRPDMCQAIRRISRTNEELTRLNAVRSGIRQTSSALHDGVALILSMVEDEMAQVRSMSDRVDQLTEGITAGTEQMLAEVDKEIVRLNAQLDEEIEAALSITGGRDGC